MVQSAICGSSYAKTSFWAYTDSEGPGKPALPRNLIRTSLSANRITGYYRTCEWRAYALIILFACAGLFKSAHFAHVGRHFFA